MVLLPIDSKVVDVDKSAILEQLRGSLLTFGKIIRPNVHYAEPSEVHFEVEKELLDRTNTKLNIILPRGLAKTTIAGEDYPMFHIFMEPTEYTKVVVIISKTQSHSINRLRAIKDVLEYSPTFRALFGYWGSNNAQRWRDDEIILKDGTVIVAKGMGQPIRGMNYGGIRPTLLLLDDPEDENNTKTSESMEANLRWLLQGALPSLDNRYGRCIVIGTPLHQRCIVETLKNQFDKTWRTIHYSYLVEEEEGLKSIWPEVKSVDFLLTEKAEYENAGRVSIWYAERMCQLVGDTDQLFRPEDMRYWMGEYVTEQGQNYLKIVKEQGQILEEPKVIPVNIFIGVDPASSLSNKADYSVIFPIAVDSDMNIYCLPYFRDRIKPHGLADKIYHYGSVIYKNVQRMRIETNAYQVMLRDEVKRIFTEQDIYIPGLEIKETATQSKEKKYQESLQSLFARKKVYLREDMQTFEDELFMFPRGSHDDTIDGFYLAQKGIYAPSHGVVTHSDQPKILRKNRSGSSNLGWITA